MTLADPTIKAGWLRIRTKAGEPVVFCPFRGGQTTVESCRICEFCDGVAIDPTGRNSFLLCNRSLVEAKPEHRPDVFERERPESEGPSIFKEPVSRAMTRNVVTVSADLSLEELIALFAERGISGAPVIDDERRPIGVVSKSDLLMALERLRREAPQEAPIELTEIGDAFAFGPGFHVENSTGLTALDLMTPMTFMVDRNATIARASALMAYEGVHRLPVVDDENRVVGLLSAIDILRWIAHEDGYRVPAYTQHQKQEAE